MIDRVQFRNLLITHFNLEEFKDLCFELSSLGVSYEELAGDGLGAKARELILFCERANITPALIAACRQMRPRVVWDMSAPVIPAQTSPSGPEQAASPAIPATGPVIPTLSQPPVPTTSPDPLESHYTVLLRAIIDGRLVPFLGLDINLCGRATDTTWRPGQDLPSMHELSSYLSQKLAEKGWPTP